MTSYGQKYGSLIAQCYVIIKDKRGVGSGTVLPAKSDSDVMFCYQVIRNLESIDYLCSNPILRIG